MSLGILHEDRATYNEFPTLKVATLPGPSAEIRLKDDMAVQDTFRKELQLKQILQEEGVEGIQEEVCAFIVIN